VVAEDVDVSGVSIAPAWVSETHAYTGVLDGKGHTVSNLTLSTGSWAGFVTNIFAGTIKNVAFVNFDNNPWGGANGLLAGRVDGGRLENVYISGNSRSCNFLFGAVGENGVTLDNVVLNFASSSGENGIIAKDMTNVTATNVVIANDGSDFFTENANLEFGDFKMTEAGLTFNGKNIYAKPE
jgi:hypothetical protein